MHSIVYTHLMRIYFIHIFDAEIRVKCMYTVDIVHLFVLKQVSEEELG
jgi:hypothetical protein